MQKNVNERHMVIPRQLSSLSAFTSCVWRLILLVAVFLAVVIAMQTLAVGLSVVPADRTSGPIAAGLPAMAISRLAQMMAASISAAAAATVPATALDTKQPLPRSLQAPPLLLWAWEQPADLSFIDTSKTGVAALSGTLYLRGDDVVARMRLQPLVVPPGTYMATVVRIETDRSKQPTLSDKQLSSLVFHVIEILASKPVQALQIDFDATVTERLFYRHFLQQLRQAMPEAMPLSITSLASWCLRDCWIADLPVDEVVPMFFSMGQDRKRALTLLASESGLSRLPMAESVGLSTDEPDVVAALQSLPEHIYLFSPKGWRSSRIRTWVKTFESGGTQWKTLAKR